MREQDDCDGHARFMDALAEQGFVAFGGPIGEGDRRFMFAVEAPSEEAVRERLATDPWERTRQLQTVDVQPWEILLRATP